MSNFTRDMETFINAFQLIENNLGWTTHADARDSEGHRVSATSASAFSFCSIGALLALSDKPTSNEMILDFASYISRTEGLSNIGCYALQVFNDDNSHSVVIAKWIEYGKYRGFLSEDFTLK